MTKSLKQIGRPTFRIDKTRLSALRKEASLTQLELATRTYESANKTANLDVLKNTAQRWESRGAVPREMASHLAKVLGTTVAVLQGHTPEPAVNMVDEFERLISARVAAGACPELIEALDKVGQLAEEGIQPERSLATWLSKRLEVAQMSQASELFIEIAMLTGLTVAQLRRPMSHDGFWLLVETGFSGPERYEILSGVAQLKYQVISELTRHFEHAGLRDSKATFFYEPPWFRVTLSDTNMRGGNRVLRFVRCQPNESGIQWASASWLDRFWIDELERVAYSHASFVTGFKGIQVPSNLKNLRLAVIKNEFHELNQPFEKERSDNFVAMTSGSIHELTDQIIENFGIDHQMHHLHVNRLRSGLWEVVKPLLSGWPLDFWYFSIAQTDIAIHMEVPRRAHMQFVVPPRQGLFFRVILVEELKDGLKRTPWTPASVAHVFEALDRDFKTALAELAISVKPFSSA